jgi:hypothetical protein
VLYFQWLYYTALDQYSKQITSTILYAPVFLRFDTYLKQHKLLQFYEAQTRFEAPLSDLDDAMASFYIRSSLQVQHITQRQYR